MRKYLSHLPLLLILILAGMLYFYRLPIIPPGFYADEGLPAYSAYSILKTAKDEYGKLLPIAFRFLGFFGPPLYTYLTVLSLAIFGPTIFAVRAVSAFSGLVGIVVIYFLANELLRNFPSKLEGKVRSNRTKGVLNLGHLAALLLAISPWTVLYARTGYEILLGTVILASSWLFLYQALEKPRFLPLGLLLLSLSTYTAYTQRFLAPLFLVCYVVIFRKKLFSKSFSKYLFLALLLTFLTQLPNLYLLITPAFFTKGSLGLASPTIFGLIREFASQYLNYFSPQSLFFLADPDPQRSIPNLATFYSWLFLPYLVGLKVLYNHRHQLSAKYLILIFLLTPIPASLTHDPFSSHRVLPMIIPLIIILSLGLQKLLSLAPKTAWPILLLLIIFSLRQLYLAYFLLLPIERAKYWDYGVAQLAQEIKTRPTGHFVIDQANVQPSYINLAFFLQYPPEKIQEELDPAVSTNYYYSTEFKGEVAFGNLEFRKINWQIDIYQDQILVGDNLAISQSQAAEHYLLPLFVIKDPLGEIRFQAFHTQPKLKCQASTQKSPYCNQIQ